MRDYAPLQQRVRSASGRLRAVPVLLAQGRANLGTAPAAWTERAVRECDGALAFLGQGIDTLIAENAITAPGLREAANVAAAAFAEFRAWLAHELRSHASDDYAVGAEFFDVLMARGHHFDRDSAALAARAREVSRRPRRS